jgi:hypothetical protein
MKTPTLWQVFIWTLAIQSFNQAVTRNFTGRLARAPILQNEFLNGLAIAGPTVASPIASDIADIVISAGVQATFMRRMKITGAEA